MYIVMKLFSLVIDKNDQVMVARPGYICLVKVVRCQAVLPWSWLNGYRSSIPDGGCNSLDCLEYWAIPH